MNKTMLEEVGDYLLASKGTMPTASVKVSTTEYRSSMALGSSIKPSVIVRQGRPLTVQGRRIY